MTETEKQIWTLLDKARHATYADERAKAAVRLVTKHTALTEQRDRLAAALREVRAMFFKYAQAGAYIEKDKLTPLDNEQHPWIPGVEAPTAIQVIDNALATVEQGGGESVE